MFAVILAGAGEITGAGTPGYKAGLSIGEETMLGKAVNVVSRLREVDKIVVVGEESILSTEERRKVWRVVAPAGSFFANLARGMANVPEAETVLVVASDMPLITTEACEDFLRQCRKREAEVYYPVVPKEVYEESFPGSRRTYVHLSDGVFTGGNMALMKNSFFRRHRHLLNLVIKTRKRPWILALRFGIGFWWRFAHKKISLSHIEELVREKYKFTGAAVISTFSEMGFDVDTTEDLDWIKFYWAGVKDGWQREEKEEKLEWLM